MTDDKFLDVAKKAALEAGKIISKYSGSFGEKIIKGGDKSNFATKADIEAEEIIIEILSKYFPDHNIIGEEKGKINKGSAYTWAIDPVDGTFSFAHGIPYFSTSIGLLFNNEPYVGVINHVTENNLYQAQKAKGVFLNNKKIATTKVSNLEESAVGLDVGHKQTRKKNIESYGVRLMSRCGYPYIFGSAVTNQALVAQGMLDGYVAEAWIWDFVAGAVIVREAGGKVTDFSGNEPDWSKERLNIVASNGLIHDQMLEALKA